MRDKVLGPGMTNLDRSVDAGLAGHLRGGGTGTHFAWSFNGTLRFDAGKGVFTEEVFIRHVSQGTREASSLEELMRVVNDEFGWE